MTTTPANEIGIGHSRAVVAPRRVARALPVQAANQQVSAVQLIEIHLLSANWAVKVRLLLLLSILVVSLSIFT